MLIFQLSQNKTMDSFDPSAFARIVGAGNSDNSGLEDRIAELEAQMRKNGGGSNDSLTELLAQRINELEEKQVKG